MPPATAHARHPRAPPFVEPSGYARHRPENTLLYQLVEQHYPAFREMRAMAGRSLPDYIEEEFDAYLKCGRLEKGFLRVRSSRSPRSSRRFWRTWSARRRISISPSCRSGRGRRRCSPVCCEFTGVGRLPLA